MTAPARREALERALRRLPGIVYVGFTELASSVVVQVIPAEGADLDGLRKEVVQLCEGHLGTPFVIDLDDAARPARVRLLDVEVTAEDEVVVQLGYGGLCQSGRSAGSDPSAAVEATFAALTNLGAPVPFHIEAAATFEHAVGDGVMVVLGSEGEGPRFGVASGRDPAQAGARAALHALNRYLATRAVVSESSTTSVRTVAG